MECCSGDLCNYYSTVSLIFGQFETKSHSTIASLTSTCAKWSHLLEKDVCMNPKNWISSCQLIRASLSMEWNSVVLIGSAVICVVSVHRESGFILSCFSCSWVEPTWKFHFLCWWAALRWCFCGAKISVDILIMDALAASCVSIPNTVKTQRSIWMCYTFTYLFKATLKLKNKSPSLAVTLLATEFVRIWWTRTTISVHRDQGNVTCEKLMYTQIKYVL